MPYKGNDLELRLPEAIPAGEPDKGTSNGTERDWFEVDVVVLACCNEAYDVAAFHRASEVRPEHLLHAVTRVDDAISRIEQLGVRRDRLWRETTIAIASQPPSSETQSAPLTSSALRDIMNIARTRAAGRPETIAFDDLLRALLQHDSQTAALLLAAADDAEALQRWRDQPDEPALKSAFAPDSDGTPASALNQLLTRLAAMEAAVSALHADADAERRSTGDLLRQMLAELRDLRESGARSTAPDQIKAISAAVEEKLKGLDKTAAALAAHVDTVQKSPASDEESMEEQAREIATALVSRLSGRLAQTEGALQRVQDETARHWRDTGERLIALEAMIRAHLQGAQEATAKNERDLNNVCEVLVKLGSSHQALASALNTWRLDNSGDVSIISNRLEQIEQTALDVLGQLSSDFRSAREQALEGGSRSNGFKRWLHGTTSGLAARAREGPLRRGLSQMLGRAGEHDPKS